MTIKLHHFHTTKIALLAWALASIMTSGCNNEIIHEHHAQECLNAADCPVGSFCDEGCCHVFDGCQSDSECGSSEICLCDGLCYELICSLDLDCPQGSRCEGGFCRMSEQACMSSFDCACGEVCMGGTCSLGCGESGDCCGEEICEEGLCVPPRQNLSCETNDQCAENTVCNTTSGQCEARCSSDNSCPDGTSCQANGLCYEQCSETLPCQTPGTFCDVDGFCKQGTTCENDDQCPTHQFCGESGLCTEASKT